MCEVYLMITMKFNPDKTYSFYQPSVEGNRILAVFENPTWKEQMLNRPSMGETGIHLSMLFNILRNMECQFAKDFCNQLFKYHVGIVNAIRFSGDLANVTDSVRNWLIIENAERFATAMKNAELVLLFGENAQAGYTYFENHLGKEKDKHPKCVISIYHLSRRALAKISNATAVNKFLERKHAVGFTPRLPNEVQLAIIAEYIASKYEENNNCELGFKQFQDFIRPFLRSGDGKIQKEFGTIKMAGGS